MVGIPTWIFVATLAVIAKSGYQIQQKYLTQKYNSIILAQAIFLISSVIFVTLSIIIYPNIPSYQGFLYAGLAGLLVSSGIWMLNSALKEEDLSVVSPLQQTIPVFASIIEPIILSELGYNPLIIISAVVTTIGAYIIVVEPGNLYVPIKRLRNKGPVFSLLTALFLAGASILTHIATQSLPILYFLATETVIGFLFLLIASKGKRPPINKDIIGISVLFALNLGLSITTLSLVVASKATIFFRISLIINVLFGVYILGESNIKYKLLGSIIIIIGIILSVL